MARIFVVEDNENITEALSSYLALNDHQAVVFPRLAGVLEAMRMQPPDLLILDVMLPDGDGFAFARKLKREFAIPLIFLTARTSESDRILGLELGADDYVVKPFSAKELMLRIQAVLRRSRPQAPPGGSAETAAWHLEEHTLTIDRPGHRLVHDGRPVELTAAEWKILLLLADNTGSVVPRERLLASALAYLAEGSERTIDTHIKNIRGKLGYPGWLETVRGFGYRFAGAGKKP